MNKTQCKNLDVTSKITAFIVFKNVYQKQNIKTIEVKNNNSKLYKSKIKKMKLFMKTMYKCLHVYISSNKQCQNKRIMKIK